MVLRVDLHMHSCLSPCGSEEMTPNDLVNMAWLKGLDAIAVADHNSARNLPACAQVAAARGLVLVPALEVTCAEEVHLLCYFHDVAAALAMGDWLYQRLPDVRNRAAFFGEQQVMDAEDRVVAVEEKLLTQAVRATLAQVAAQAAALDGVAVPAHINRGANSLLGVLGMFPADVRFTAVEIDPRAPAPHARLLPPGLRILNASDAHALEAIAEPGFALEAEERSVAAILRALRAGETPQG